MAAWPRVAASDVVDVLEKNVLTIWNEEARNSEEWKKKRNRIEKATRS